jgi:Flp pilus assembly pilin Flp
MNHKNWLNLRPLPMGVPKNWLSDERGAATAEYAIATMAAVGFAGLLVVIMRSDEVRTILFDLVKSALTFTNPNDAAAH